MKSVFKPLLLAAVLASAGFAAFSQPMGGGDCFGMMGGVGPMQGGRHQGRMGNMDPAKMQAMQDRHHAALKASLKLTAAQEGAWTTFTAAMKPPADMAARMAEHAALVKLPTPERIDKMKALRAQRMGEMTVAMDQRGEAVKAFYAVLTPEQQKVFDAHAMQKPRDGGRMGGMRDGKGPGPAKP